MGAVSGGGRVFFDTASASGTGDLQTFNVLSIGGVGTQAGKIQFDCSKKLYRRVGRADWWSDDPATVERVCKKNFAGLKRFTRSELDVVAADEANQAERAIVNARTTSPAGTYLHPHSQTPFPLELAGFRRTKITWITDEGDWILVQYEKDSPKGKIYFTVGVHPLDIDRVPHREWGDRQKRAYACERELENELSLWMYIGRRAKTNLRLEARSKSQVRVEGRDYLGFSASYTVDLTKGGRVERRRTRKETFCDIGAARVIGFEAYSPAQLDVTASFEKFIDEGPWPGREMP